MKVVLSNIQSMNVGWSSDNAKTILRLIANESLLSNLRRLELHMDHNLHERDALLKAVASRLTYLDWAMSTDDISAEYISDIMSKSQNLEALVFSLTFATTQRFDAFLSYPLRNLRHLTVTLPQPYAEKLPMLTGSLETVSVGLSEQCSFDISWNGFAPLIKSFTTHNPNLQLFELVPNVYSLETRNWEGWYEEKAALDAMLPLWEQLNVDELDGKCIQILGLPARALRITEESIWSLYVVRDPSKVDLDICDKLYQLCHSDSMPLSILSNTLHGIRQQGRRVREAAPHALLEWFGGKLKKLLEALYPLPMNLATLLFEALANLADLCLTAKLEALFSSVVDSIKTVIIENRLAEQQLKQGKLIYWAKTFNAWRSTNDWFVERGLIT